MVGGCVANLGGHKSPVVCVWEGQGTMTCQKREAGLAVEGAGAKAAALAASPYLQAARGAGLEGRAASSPAGRHWRKPR